MIDIQSFQIALNIHLEAYDIVAKLSGGMIQTFHCVLAYLFLNYSAEKSQLLSFNTIY